MDRFCFRECLWHPKILLCAKPGSFARAIPRERCISWTRIGLPYCFVPLGTLGGFLFVSVKQLSPCDKSTAGRHGLVIQAVNVSPSGNQEVELSSFFDDVLLLFEC